MPYTVKVIVNGVTTTNVQGQFGQVAGDRKNVLTTVINGQVAKASAGERKSASTLAIPAQLSEISATLINGIRAAASKGIEASMCDAVVQLSIGRLEKVMASGKATKEDLTQVAREELRQIWDYFTRVRVERALEADSMTDDKWVEVEDDGEDEQEWEMV